MACPQLINANIIPGTADVVKATSVEGVQRVVTVKVYFAGGTGGSDWI